MPEGHAVHRLAHRITDTFATRPTRSGSPQGRFAEAAARLDGRVLEGAEAHGKHLFVDFEDLPDRVHIHLGIYGKWRFAAGTDHPAVGQIRWRLVGSDTTADLRGPAACALIDPDESAAIEARLGPDPLRPDADPRRAFERITRTRRSIASLLMDQSVVSGVGNIYRAELLFRHGLPPNTPGRLIDEALWEQMWVDLADLMADGVRVGRIDTVRDEHLPEAMGRAPREDAHGGEVYVYRRAGQPCWVCGTPVRTDTLEARNLFWCARCQSDG